MKVLYRGKNSLHFPSLRWILWRF